MPRMNRQALTTKVIKGHLEPGTYSDGFGLNLRVDANGNKRWIQRLTIAGRQRNMGLGSFPAVDLQDARKQAAGNYRLGKEGKDPIEARKVQKATAKMPKAPMFREVAERVMKLRRPDWRPSVAYHWRQSLECHVFPMIGDKLVYDVTRGNVMAILEPVWTTKPRMASYLKDRLHAILGFAEANGLRPDNPVAAVVKGLPKRRGEKRHHEAMPHTQIPGFLRDLRQYTATGAVTRLALEFLVLTATRGDEVCGMTWEEIALDNATWTVPASRMKMRREHRVPLSQQAQAVLFEAASLPNATPGSGLVFPSTRGGRQARASFSRVLTRMGLTARAHGFRSSFKDWSLEVEGADWAVSEAALAHQLGNTVEASYARTDLFDKRRELMDAWADYLHR